MNDRKVLSVWGFQSVSYAAVLANAKDIIIILSTLIAMGYTIWRWHQDYLKNKNNKRN